MSMRSIDSVKFLSAFDEPLSTLDWVQKNLLPQVISRLNEVEYRKRLALFGGDRIPENERNLTDFRNRISLIIEYEFARLITDMIDQHSKSDLFCSYVVANRFPDLEIRSSEGELGLRFEVKCLQSTAEEKSANFSTLKKDIRPSSDFIVVFLWEWSTDSFGICWDRAPQILKAYVFHASSLATLRDFYWLNKPPGTLGDGFQGFDVEFAVNCVGGKYNEEEGNYGKLLRLWNSKFRHELGMTQLLSKTEEDYEAFKSSVVLEGFRTLSFQMLPILSSKDLITEFCEHCNGVGYKSGDFGFFIFQGFIHPSRLHKMAREVCLSKIWVFNEKYKWRCYLVKKECIQLEEEGSKPKYITQNRRGD
ncbi:MAG: hypothetical protein OXC62_17830 [Aestuariivita sp.]|nr:hypothetical protein [Aestuariivita sp.]